MNRVIRSLTLMLSVLAVVLTAGAVGAARGQASVAGQIVICSGQGPVTITLDENGEPTGPVHWCPDCAVSLFGAAAPAAPHVASPAEIVLAVDFLEAVPAVAAQSAICPQARGPPVAA